MKENCKAKLVCFSGLLSPWVTCLFRKGNTMTHTRYAFIKAKWHPNIVDRSLEGFLEVISKDLVDVYDVPGALEMPLMAKSLAETGKYSVIAAAAFVVDGGIYRHDFVAQAVVDGLVQAGMETNIPVLSISLTPHQYQETEFHDRIFQEHFKEKGREAANAALGIIEARSKI